MKQTTLLVSAAASAVLLAPGLHAAGEDDNSTAAADQNIEVITVTAQKRTERLSEVPIAISVFSDDKLSQTGVQELRELGDFIPNLRISQSTDTTSRITIRGVGANSRNIGFDTRVGVYLDGVYLGQSPALNQDLVDLERVEVLRGPQGTLFGKNTVAGAINLISEKPQQSFSSQLTLNLGNHDAVEVKAKANLPISDTLSAKIALSSRQRDGYVTNNFDPAMTPEIPVPLPPEAGGGLLFLPTGPDAAPRTTELNDQDTQSYRAQLRFQPNADWDINLSIDGLQSERHPVLGLPLTNSFGQVPVTLPEDTTSVGTLPYEERDILGASLTVDYDMDNGYALRAISGYRDTELFYRNDSDYDPFDWARTEYTDRYRQRTQELQLISPDNADFKYVVGFYYYDQQGDTDRTVSNGNAAFLLPGGINMPGTPVNNRGRVDTESYALFASGSYQLDNRWNIGFGLRYSDESKDVDWRLDGSHSGVYFIGSTPDNGLQDSRSDNYLAPTVSLNYAYAGNLNTYLKYGSAFKSGGYNLDYITQPDLAAGIEFDKETVDSYEIGLKSHFLDNDLKINLAYFIADYDDYQVNQFFDLGGGTTSIRITNAAKVDTSGLELEMSYRATDNFTIDASLGWLDASFDNFPNGASINGTPVNARNNDLPFAADFNAALGLTYYTPLQTLGVDLFMRLDVTHTSDYFTTTDNIRQLQLPGLPPGSPGAPDGVPPLPVEHGHVNALTLLNGRIGLLSDQSDWELYLWARNLTDERKAINSIRDFFGTTVETPNTPRMYGLELIYNF